MAVTSPAAGRRWQVPEDPRVGWPDLLGHATGPQLILLALLLLIGTDLIGMSLGTAASEAVAQLIRKSKQVLYLGVLGMAVMHYRMLWRGVTANPELALLLSLTCASALWSVDRGETIERLIPLMVSSILGALVGAALPQRQLMVFVALFCAVMAFASLAAVAAFPEARGAPPWDGVWRGIFNHKNKLGAASAVGAVFLTYAVLVTKGGLARVLGAGLFATLLLLAVSESRTGQLIGVLVLLSLCIGLVLQRDLRLWATVTVLGTVGAFVAGYLVFATGLSDLIFEAMGRKPTMSNRLPLWELTWPKIQDAWLLGYGYAAFWDPEARRVIEIARDPSLGFTPYYGHNGLIETMLNIGLVGMMAVLLVLGRAVWTVLRLLARVPGQADLIPALCYVIMFCLLNVTESTVLSRDDMIWMLLVAVLVRLALLRRALDATTEVAPMRGRKRRPTTQRRWSGLREAQR